MSPLNARKLQPFVWDGNWQTLPATLDARHMAAILGVGVDCIWDRCQRKTIRQKPISWVRPYRWNRASVQASVERGAAA